MADSFKVRLQDFFSAHVTRARPHAVVYRLTGGRIGSRMPTVGPGVLLLTATGRKSGRQRTTPLVYFDIEGQEVVAATNNGLERLPDWYRNVVANPETEIQVGRERRSARARVAEGAERERLWSRMKEMHPLFARYEQRSPRQIPVVVLETQPAPSS